jgi:DNA (cytosine-5)-methyltransferase 1
MRYLSVCSGIEAASVAWEPIGWEPAAFAEIEAFPSAVLAKRFPGVPNLGDITRHREWPDLGTVDLVCGGTPCQSFSVAGLRAGLADPRGNLCLTYLAIVDRYRPRWTVWENVPGVLSSDGGRDFGAFLGGLGQLGYGWCYRVLDAQYVRVDGFPGAVPQRRRRLFVVGHTGDWRRAAAVLSEPQGLQGYHPPRRQAGQGTAPTIASRPTGGGGLGTDFDCDGGLIASTGDVSHCLNAGGMGRQDYETETMVAHAFRKDAGRDGVAKTPSPDGKGRIRVAFDIKGNGPRMRNAASEADVHTPLRARMPGQSEASTTTVISSRMAIRRLMPVECERLQGFPDGWTDVEYRGNPAADGPRYKALGNSMAVNVMRWIGRRIEMVEGLA